MPDFSPPPDPLGSPPFLRVAVAMLMKRLGVDQVELTDADIEAIRGHHLLAGPRPEGCILKLVPPEPEPLIIVPRH